MPLLHIEHGVNDLDTWLKVFNAFEPQRKAAGVTQVRLGQPVGDPHHVVIDLEFETTSAADDFRTFLRENVWTSADASNVMTGTPTAIILTEIRS
ncbi:hypothetical protein H7K24_10585 [Mycobacterium fragae]|nr:hypothetical protein [Mycobacterium fragae]MCV7400604.1 hypothetical protein [Mycobacterium fragae]